MLCWLKAEATYILTHSHMWRSDCSSFAWRDTLKISALWNGRVKLVLYRIRTEQNLVRFGKGVCNFHLRFTFYYLVLLLFPGRQTFRQIFDAKLNKITYFLFKIMLFFPHCLERIICVCHMVYIHSPSSLHCPVLNSYSFFKFMCHFGFFSNRSISRR